MTNYNDGKWHGWNGGECPVHPKDRVDVLWIEEDGCADCAHEAIANIVAWDGIDAFRVVKEHREPREWWIGCDGCAYADEELAPTPHIAHVREVLDND